MPQKIDDLVENWVGAWFPLMAEMGEDVHIPFGRLDKESGEVEWVRIPHERFDGVGGLTHLLRERGWQTGELPKRNEAQPAGWEIFISVMRYFQWAKVRHTRWRQYNSSKRGPTCKIVWHVFSKQETDRLSTLARSKGYSVNSLLLFTLNQNVLKVFLDDGNPYSMWWIPVNMRGPVTLARETSNHTSYVGVEVYPDMTPLEIYKSVRKVLEKKNHWGAWWGLNSGRWIGIGGMRRTLGYFERKENRWVGTLTNMGDWPPPGFKGEGPEKEVWMVGCVVTIGHPIGAGCITWDGQLALTLQVHAALTENQELVKRFFDGWIERIKDFQA